MKQTVFILTLLFVFLLLPLQSHAVTKTVSPTDVPSPSTTDNKINDQINTLKEKIASRVAELNLVEKRGIIGVVQEVTSNKITVTDFTGGTRYIDVDEITKFSSSSNKSSFGLSDLTKGTKISVTGLYNKQSRRILARFIDTTTTPLYISGAVSDVDKKNFMLTVNTADQKSVKVDIQSSTKLYSYTDADNINKYGFSKIAIGDRVMTIGFPSKTDATLLEAERVIILLGLPKDPKVIVSQPSATVSQGITPSTGNGKKITPIKK